MMTKARVYSYTFLMFLVGLVLVLWLTGGDFGVSTVTTTVFFFGVVLTTLAVGLAEAGDKHLAPYKEKIGGFATALGVVVMLTILLGLLFF